MGTASYYTPKPREECFDSVKDSCFLVRWLRIHCFINLCRTICRPLTKKEMFNTTKDLQPEVNYDRYCLLRTKHPSQGFSRIIFQRQFLWSLLWASFVGMIAAGLSYAGPVFLKHIIEYINNKTPASGQQNHAYLFAALWLVAYLFRIFFDQQAQWNCFAIATKVDQIMNLAIYDKMGRMSSADRRLFEQGDFMTFFTIDTRIVTTFVKSFYVLFSAPTTLITAQVFLYIEAGTYGLVLTGVLLLSMVLQVCICWKVAKLGVQKLGHFQNRIASNIQMFSNLKQIKSLAWEELISKKNEEMRKPENLYNRKLFIYNGIYNFVVSFAPALTIFLILVIDLAVRKSASFTPTYVYTLISYIALIYGPLNSLPSTIIAAFQTATCSKRMNKLLEMPEKADHSDSILPAGQVLIKHYVAGWNSRKTFGNPAASNVHASRTQVASSENMESAWNLCRDVDEGVRDGAFQIKIPRLINLQAGERIIVLGGNNSGKSSFFQAILGNLVTQYGQLQVGGKIGYVPQIPFMKRDTIKNNIMFGAAENREKLDMVEEFMGLANELNNLEKYDSAIMEDVSVLLSPVLRHKISLARALYHDPDVFLIDDIFTDMDIQSVRKLLGNFEKLQPFKTLMISTALTSIIRPRDHVIIFERGSAIEYGVFQELLGNPSSYIHQFRRSESAVLEKMLLLQSRLRGGYVPRSAKVSLRAIPPVKSLSGSAQYRVNHQNHIASNAKPAAPQERPKGVPLQFFLRFIKSGTIALFVVLVLMITVGQALNVFSLWWIGNAKTKFLQLNIHQIIGIYVGLVCTFGVLSFLCCLLVAYMSILSTQQLASKIIKNVEKADLSWVEKQNKIFMTIILSRDNEEMYTLYNYYQSALNNLLFYLGTLILNGISSGLFFILGFSVLIINGLAVLLYIRAERELFWIGIPMMRELNNVLEDSIIGVDTIRSYGKTKEHRQDFVDLLYKFGTVYKCNNRWILQGLSIFADVTGLAVTFGAAMFGIHSKSTTKHPSLVAIAITLSNRLSSISSNISRDIANLEIQTRLTVNLPFTYGGKQPELNYQTPQAPKNWPLNNSVRFQKVTFKNPQYDVPIINELSFSAEGCTRVAVTSQRSSTSIQTFMMLINKLRVPANGQCNFPGEVFVGGVPLDRIGRKHLRNYVQLYDHSPFIFTSTLRKNLDPFQRFNDDEIQMALEKVGLWNETSFFPTSLCQSNAKDKLNYHIEDAGINVSLGHKQLINIARAILQKPPVLLCDYVSSAVAQKYRAYLNELLLKEFDKCLVFIATHDTSVLPHFDHHINLDTGQSETQLRSSKKGFSSDEFRTFLAMPATSIVELPRGPSGN